MHLFSFCQIYTLVLVKGVFVNRVEKLSSGEYPKEDEKIKNSTIISLISKVMIISRLNQIKKT